MFLTNQKRGKKADFHADFESVEKVVKKCTKKSFKHFSVTF